MLVCFVPPYCSQIFPRYISPNIQYLAIELLDALTHFYKYFSNFCASSNIFLSLFYAGAASSQQRLRLRYFVTADNSIMTRGGTSGNCRKCQRDLNRCGTPTYPGNSSKHPLPRPENVAQKKLPLIERFMAFERVNMGRIYGRRHLQMFSHPSGVSFSSPLLLSFLSVGFVWLELAPTSSPTFS